MIWKDWMKYKYCRLQLEEPNKNLWTFNIVNQAHPPVTLYTVSYISSVFVIDFPVVSSSLKLVGIAGWCSYYIHSIYTNSISFNFLKFP